MKSFKLIIVSIIMISIPLILWADAPDDNPARVKSPCGLSNDMNCFEDGKTAYAPEVNANFKALYDRVQVLTELECSYNINKKICPYDYEIFVFKSYNSELNNASAKFTTIDGSQILWVIPALGNSGWNPHSANGDFGLIWTDHKAQDGTNGNSGLVIGPHTGSAAGIKIQANGNVGIGVPQPLKKLHVGGEAIIEIVNCSYYRDPGRMHIAGGEALFILNQNGAVISKSFGGSGDLVVEGNTTFYQDVNRTSDIRFKKDITPLTNTLTKTLALKPVYFNWKTDEYKEKNFSTKKQIGFIANDVETIIPESVHTDQKGIKYIDYGKITPVIVGAIQKLNTKISDLEKKHMKKISRLEKENSALKKMLAEYGQLVQRIALLEISNQKHENKSVTKVIHSNDFEQ